jgi:hypothetical protein
MTCEAPGTNLVRNPRAFATALQATAFGVTLTRDTGVYHRSPASWKIVSDNLAADEYAQFDAPPSFTGQITHTASAMVWASAPGTTVKILGILWENGGGSSDYASATAVVGTTPTMISVTVPMDNSVQVSDGYVRIGTDAQAAATIYVSDLQLEAGIRTSYIDGTLGMGYAHVGTAWETAHTRSAYTDACESAYDSFQLR